MNLKKKLAVLLAVLILSFSAMPFAYAEPEDGEGQEVQYEETVEGEAEGTEQTGEEAPPAEEAPQEQAPAENVPPPAEPIAPQQTQETEFKGSKYLTKGWAAFWFILTFIAGGAFSFWVGNRFYRLARKDNHLSAEVRALRRDIDDKFTGSISGFSEQQITFENHNENLAVSDEGIIKKAPKKPSIRDLTPEEEERFRRWEEAQSKPKGERTKARSAVREEFDDDLEEVRKLRRKNYQPKRKIDEQPPEESFDEEVFDEEESEGAENNLEETKVIPKAGGVRLKAKEILNDIFPFKED